MSILIDKNHHYYGRIVMPMEAHLFQRAKDMGKIPSRVTAEYRKNGDQDVFCLCAEIEGENLFVATESLPPEDAILK